MTKIMVVDDEPHIMKLIEFTLGKRGYEIVTASDGMSAVDLAEHEMPDLILMDVMMPIMNGYEAVKLIKDNPKTKDIPVAMLSAKSQKYEVETGLSCGAEEYICKPFTPSALVEKVTALLGD